MANRGKADLATLALLEHRGQVFDRYQDLTIAIKTSKDKILAEVGGVWDSHDGQYSDKTAKSGVSFQLIPDQVEPFKYFLGWLTCVIKITKLRRDGVSLPDAVSEVWGEHDPLDLMHLHGGRKGGKTRVSLFMCFCVAVAIPKARVAIVAPTGRRFTELLLAMAEIFPQEWARYKAADKTWEFVNGSRIELYEGGPRIKGIKIGDIHFILINEAQELKESLVISARGNLFATAGLAALAYNPPDLEVGQWVKREYFLALAGKLPGVLTYFLNPENNPYARIGSLASLKVTNPNAYRREVLGDMTAPIEDTVFPQWNPDTHRIVLIPNYWVDVTSQISKTYYGKSAPWVGGLDFDYDAGCSYSFGKWFLKDESDSLDDAVFVIYNGHRLEGYLERELHGILLKAVDEIGMPAFPNGPEDIVWVGDASGTWQSTTSRKKDNKNNSWVILKRKGWNLTYPDVDKKGNPRRRERFELARNYLSQEKLYVCHTANEVQESIHGHPTMPQTSEPKTKHPLAHLNDTWTYCIYRKYSAEDAQSENKKSGPQIFTIPRE